MLLLLLIVPIIGVFIISAGISYELNGFNKNLKTIALTTSIINLLLSLIVFILFDFSSNLFQFVQEYHEIGSYEFYLGLDGLSIYFVLLTTVIIPIALLSNLRSISENVRSYAIIVLLLETLLLAVFLVLDILLFYIFFESILPPLFLLIGLFGSSNKVRASFYLFLYTLFGSLFLLLSILTISSIMGITDLDGLYKTNFYYSTQLLLFLGVFFAFAVKTPTIFLNSWLLKAHVESPLGGSIILAGIVLKLSLYGIFRLILPLLPKVSLDYTYIVYLIGVLTIIYASLSTLRTTDIKELIAYSSVCHAAVYLIGVFSNTIQGIEGGIALGLAHGFVSSGLFFCAGGVLYDRCDTRLIILYRGIAQCMPIFSILFFILCLGNMGTPLTLNFVGELLCLFGAFRRHPVIALFASCSIFFSAAYTMIMFNRAILAGSFSKYFKVNISDLNKREFLILFTLVVFTVVLGIYSAPILDGLHYSVSSLIYSSPSFEIIPSNVALLSVLFVVKMESSTTTRSTSEGDLHRVSDSAKADAILRKQAKYPRLTHHLKFYTDTLRRQAILNRSYNSLEWAWNSPAKPHAFVTLPLQSVSNTVIFMLLFLKNVIKSKLVSKIKSEVNKLITDWFILIISTMPDLALALLILSLAIYLEYFTAFTYGELIIYPAVIYIYIYMNFMYPDFKDKYPWLYLALTFVCVISIIFKPLDIFNIWNGILKMFSGFGSNSQGGGGRGKGPVNGPGGQPPGGPNGPRGPGGPYKPSGVWPSADGREQRKRFYDDLTYEDNLPKTREKISEVVDGKGKNTNPYHMDGWVEDYYNVTALDHNTVCYHFANHPKKKKFIMQNKDMGDLVYTGPINKQMYRELCKDRRKMS